jgi:hypothetical protein
MSMTLIQHIELGSNQASIEFTSIPATFTDLYLLISARSDSPNGAQLLCRLNADSGNHSSRLLEGNGSSASSASTSTARSGQVNFQTATANTFGSIAIYIPNYRSSQAKSFSSDAVTENNGTLAIADINAVLYSQTTAVTSIQLLVSSAGFATNSSATLYGITAGSSGGVTIS